MILLVYGSRDWINAHVIQEAIRLVSPSVVIHGDCETGADRIADVYCEKVGIQRVRVPAPWNGTLRNGAGPARNRFALMLAETLALEMNQLLIASGFRLRPNSRGTNQMHGLVNTAVNADTIACSVFGDLDTWLGKIHDDEFLRVLEFLRLREQEEARLT